MSDRNHGDASRQEQAAIAGVEQPDAQRQAQAEAERRELLRQGPARLQHAQRDQVELLAVDLESVLPPDHQARLVWGFVQRQDWSEIESRIKARGSAPGRRAIDPRILYALWLYATLEGVGSGREIARLSCVHDAYRWICGGVGVNYHALNDFRAENERWFDGRLTDNVAALAASGVIKLERVAHDGVRVRANAGAASFRRREKLTKHQAQPTGARRRRASVRRSNARNASKRRWSDCPRSRRPSGATAAKPRTREPAPPTRRPR